MPQRRYLTGEDSLELPIDLERPPLRTAQAPYSRRVETDVAEEKSSILVEYARVLRYYKWTILLIVFLGAVAGLLIALPQTPVYRSQTTLEIQSLNDNLLNTRELDPNATSADFNIIETNLPTQIKIIQSETLLSRVIAKLKLENRQEVLEQPGRISVWRKALGLSQKGTTSTREQALAMASRNLQVRVLPQTRIIALSCNSTDPRIAAEFANTLANEFIDQNIEVRWQSTQHTGEWLTRQLEDIKIKLQKSEDQLQSYAYATNLMFTAEKTSVDEERLKQLQEELSTAQADRVVKQSQFGITASSPPESLPNVLDDSSLREYQKKLTELRGQLAELSALYAPGHYKVKVVQAQISELEPVLVKARSNILQRMRNEYEISLRREKILATAYAEQSKLVSEQATKAIQYNILKREVDTNRSIYESMLGKVKEYGIASAMRASNIRVIDPAKAASFPFQPDLVRSSTLGLLSGVCLALVFVFTRERADRSLQAPGEAPLYLNVPEFGVIPAAGAERKNRFYGRRSPLLPIQTGSTEDGTNKSQVNGKNGNAGKNEDSSGSVELVTWQQQPSRLAESFRATLTSILFSTENGNSPQVIVVTSCSPMAGKTTVTSNLGIALAEINRRVLLIDGDLRKPRLQYVFGLKNDRGLTDLLLEKTPVEEYPIESLAKKTPIPGLFVLPSGPATPSISNLLFSTRLPEFLRRFRREFDTVLIDTPPMMQISDARILGRLSDGVILVFFASLTSRDAAITAVGRFREDHTPVLGTILNHWNPKKNPLHEHYDNYYYYQNNEKPKAKDKSA